MYVQRNKIKLETMYTEKFQFMTKVKLSTNNYSGFLRVLDFVY